MGTKFIKLLGLIVGVAVVNVLVLSPGLIGVAIGENALSTAVGITLLFASALILLYGSYVLLFQPPVILPIKEIVTHEDYVVSLTRYRRVKTLEQDISIALAQLDRMNKKQSTLFNVINQRFDPSELSYKKFASVIQEVEKLFYLNVRSVLIRLNVYDGSEYSSVGSSGSDRFSQKLLQEKTNMHNELLSFVKSSVDTNEEILLKLDKLLLEISRLDSYEQEDIENMACMQEIDSLIKQTKFYKQ
ncbi:hypothetical protein [Cohnella mopanensis]|uniref:hypothetical protein n=1 Tax=Cohnella mopanensis TaxID=2911966 RepID=UPI001EF76453|nr:hypothetical protein [Cohnella mopanensis]